jgi:hemerythrin-like domain-containing protein
MTHHDPVHVLMHEHEVIKKVVAGLDKIATRLEGGNQVDPETLRAVVRFLREFADRCHHAKEEGILFPAMQAKGVPASGCPLEGLLGEHRQARALVTAFAEAVDAYAAGRAAAGREIVDAARKIVALYGSHMWKEDEMVFPMVDRLFSPAERDELFERFEEAEEEIGADHEALARFAEALA